MNEEPKILVPAAKAAAMLSIGKSTFWREVGKGTLPAPVKIGGRTLWRVMDLQLCVAAPANHPTTASAPAA